MSYRRWSFALFAIAVAVVLLTFTDYGVTWDEAFHVRYGDGVYEYFASGLRDREAFRYLDLYYYGAAFDLLCAVGKRLLPLDVYDSRHLLNALVALSGALGCWFLAREIGTARTAFLAALLLLLTPRYWGHGFNNPKDIPFAAGYVWSIYFLVRVMATLPRVPLRLALATGLAIGMTLAIRVGGLMLFGYLGLVMLVSFPSFRPTRDQVEGLAKSFATIAATAWAVMLSFWPWAQSRPLTAPFEAFEVMSHFTWRGTVLFAGQEIHATQIPRLYEAQWLLITLPEILLLGILLSLWYLPRAGKSFGLVAFAAAFPLVYLAIQQPIIYDGMRHVLFVVPLLACLAARALELAFDALMRRHRPVALAAAGAFSLYLAYHVSILVRLHPDEYVYFNQLVGGLPGAYGRYETDYWGNSYREAVEKLVDYIESETGSNQTPPPYRVFVCSNPPSSTTFFPTYLGRTREESEADFLIGTTRWGCHESMEGEVVAVVERLGTPLNYVVDRRSLVPPRRRF